MVAALLALGGCGTPQPAAANATDVRVSDNATVPVSETMGEPAAPTNENAGATAAVPQTDTDAAAGQSGAATAGDGSLPADVVSFRVKRDECDHFRGEEPSDDARAAFLAKATERTCTGSDAALASLRKRYANKPAVIAALASYDDEIE